MVPYENFFYEDDSDIDADVNQFNVPFVSDEHRKAVLEAIKQIIFPVYVVCRYSIIGTFCNKKHFSYFI